MKEEKIISEERNEDSESEDEEMKENAKKYVDRCFELVGKWQDFKKENFDIEVIEGIFVVRLPFSYNFYKNNFENEKGMKILKKILEEIYDKIKKKFKSKNSKNFLKFQIIFLVWQLIINENDENLWDKLQKKINSLKGKDVLSFIQERICKIPVLYVIKDKFIYFLQKNEFSRNDIKQIDSLIKNEYEEKTSKKKQLRQVIQNDNNSIINNVKPINFKKPKEIKNFSSTSLTLPSLIQKENLSQQLKETKSQKIGINARLSFSQPFKFSTASINVTQQPKKKNRLSLIEKFFEKCREISKNKLKQENILYKESTKSKIRKIIGNNFYGHNDEDKNDTGSKFLPPTKPEKEEIIENKYNILNNRKKNISNKKQIKQENKNSNDDKTILAYKTPTVNDCIKSIIAQNKQQDVTASAAKRNFYKLFNQKK